jgi:hypothetical protein
MPLCTRICRPGGQRAWHRALVPDSEPPARKATARNLVLYNPKNEWRYAIYNDVRITAIPEGSERPFEIKTEAVS